MTRRLVLAAAATLALGALATPAPVEAASLAAPATAALNADAAAENVIKVHRRWKHRRWHRRALRHYYRWHAPYWAYHRPHCGYVVRPHRIVYRCW